MSINSSETQWTQTLTALSLLIFGVSEAVSAEKLTKRASTLEEVIVTAQKRTESVQEVPIAISALSANTLGKRGISSPEDLQFSVPSLTVGAYATGGAQVTLRGVGTENNLVGGDPGVPVHIDGHYIQFSSYILRDMFDVERVEVLRGPQGTLYGRNALGGSVNIITKRPTDSLEAELTADIGNYNKRLLQGVLSGPFSDTLRGRIAVSTEKRDGYVKNTTNDQDLVDSDYTMVRGSLDYHLNEDIEFLFSAYSYKDRSNTLAQRIVGEYPEESLFAGFIPNPYLEPGVGSNITATDPGKVRMDLKPDQRDDAEGASLTIDWNLDNIVFRSLTAYNDADIRLRNQDIDGSDVVFTDQGSDFVYRTWTQEFQLLSDTSNDLNWVLGAFYYAEESTYNFSLDFYSIFGPGNPPTHYQANSDVQATSMAAFGQMDYALSEKLELVVGLRYTRDKKEISEALLVPDFGLVSSNGGPIRDKLDDSWSETTWKGGLNYFINSDMMLYASYSRGYKAGGFNAGAQQGKSYDPETINAFEAGLKSRLLDSRLQINLSAYHYDYTDKQEFQIEDVVGLLQNAGAATATGVEFELQARPTEALSLDIALNWQKAEYDEFDTVDPVFPNLGLQDLSGNKLTRAPEWKAYIGIQYEWQVADVGSFAARADYSWIDDQYYRPYNRDFDIQSAYHRTNARLTWDSEGAIWSADLYINNIEDDYIKSNQGVYAGILGNIISAQYFSPRTYGLALKYNF